MSKYTIGKSIDQLDRLRRPLAPGQTEQEWLDEAELMEALCPGVRTLFRDVAAAMRKDLEDGFEREFFGQ